MRADRLVAILMLLQRHGRLTARELASTLEVSVRTIYRDMDALSAVGIPVYAERGAYGGCCLVEDYRTDLTGMTAGEAQALLLLSAPGPLDSLGIGQDLRAALRKLYAALPEIPVGRRQDQPRVLLDWGDWDETQGTSGYLEELYQAACQTRKVKIKYRFGPAREIEQLVCPLGLVFKAGSWYLIYEANGKIRHRPWHELVYVERVEETFSYPEQFDLEETWQAVCEDAEARGRSFKAIIQAEPEALAWIRERMAAWQVPVDTIQEEGRARMEVSFASLPDARRVLIGLGGAVEVLEPEALRFSLADYARQVLERYAAG